MKTIVVQMADEQWTLEAMHLASALARSINGEIALLHLMLAKNPGLLGWGIGAPTADEQRQFSECAAVAEDYGVEFRVQPMQFVSLTDALVQAAELLHPTAFFAHISPSLIPFWGRFRLWNMKRQLHGCRLYTLDEKQPLTSDTLAPAAVWEQY